MMTKEQMDEIRTRYEDAKRKRTWLNLDEVDLSLGDIPALLEALEKAEAHSNYLEVQRAEWMRMRDGAIADRDHYKARAEAAEVKLAAADIQRPVELHGEAARSFVLAGELSEMTQRAEALKRALEGDCEACVHPCTDVDYLRDGSHAECGNWQFDQARFEGEG